MWPNSIFPPKPLKYVPYSPHFVDISGSSHSIIFDFSPFQVLSVIKVAWEDEADPEKGFKYLYLTPEDYLKLSSTSTSSGDVVRTQLVHEGDENRYGNGHKSGP